MTTTSDPIYLVYVSTLGKVRPQLWFDGDRTLQNKERPCLQKYKIKPGDESIDLDILTRLYPYTEKTNEPDGPQQ